MKKNYIAPETENIEIKTKPMLVQYSNVQAAENATTLSRESDSFWDDEEE